MVVDEVNGAHCPGLHLGLGLTYEYCDKFYNGSPYVVQLRRCDADRQ